MAGERDLSAGDLPAAARAVVVGAGIAGNCLVYHLARLGWKDIVLLDKGPLPNPGGSTGHASNFIFPVDHSKEMTALTRDSARQYEELGVLTISGGVAFTFGLHDTTVNLPLLRAVALFSAAPFRKPHGVR